MDDFAAARKARDPSAYGGLPEVLARSYLRQLMEGIHYCHAHRVLHRHSTLNQFFLIQVVFGIQRFKFWFSKSGSLNLKIQIRISMMNTILTLLKKELLENDLRTFLPATSKSVYFSTLFK